MRTLTIEIPDHLADHLDAMTPDARNNFAVAVLLDAVAGAVGNDETDALHESLAQADQDELIDGPLVMQDVFARALGRTGKQAA